MLPATSILFLNAESVQAESIVTGEEHIQFEGKYEQQIKDPENSGNSADPDDSPQ
ncbi:hypothetical protein IW492_13790 [Enterococcus sp. BWB1-3]|uniref:hypothetical protein n=1 Tax=unclassified Enterococcus TaxID=2608891 RepID=UPI001924E50D|nr:MULTISPECIES: hypothetical protein [unclassified Enterococcus]MBL1230304.1 hypothetical protein [Enterococcus sp. BWB1-3]MCB5956354.1 hypothetical protein [Enterococcus sp. CWB-B31]